MVCVFVHVCDCEGGFHTQSSRVVIAGQRNKHEVKNSGCMYTYTR